MADTIKAAFQDTAEVGRDLESVRLGLRRELNDVLRGAGDIVARKAKALTPRGPGPQSEKDNLPHIGATLSGAALPTGIAVVSSHPAAAVLEYGGTISPKGHPITFKQHAMAHKAGEAEIPRLVPAVRQRIDDLMRTHGL